MQCPMEKLGVWINEERKKGAVFPQGAVLSTVSVKGKPRSRVVGTMLTEKNGGGKILRFHTSPNSRKITDINNNVYAALTYSFNESVRSVSIEGKISPLSAEVLDCDWQSFDENFRRHYLIFGSQSGNTLESPSFLNDQKAKQQDEPILIRPDSFIGFELSIINRVSFYSVKDNDFAVNELFERKLSKDKQEQNWKHSFLVP